MLLLFFLHRSNISHSGANAATFAPLYADLWRLVQCRSSTIRSLIETTKLSTAQTRRGARCATSRCAGTTANFFCLHSCFSHVSFPCDCHSSRCVFLYYRFTIGRLLKFWSDWLIAAGQGDALGLTNAAAADAGAAAAAGADAVAASGTTNVDASVGADGTPINDDATTMATTDEFRVMYEQNYDSIEFANSATTQPSNAEQQQPDQQQQQYDMTDSIY